jgi:hypothetical protein
MSDPNDRAGGHYATISRGGIVSTTVAKQPEMNQDAKNNTWSRSIY